MFDGCGFQVKIHDNIPYLIWNKLFTNISLSAVTGILQADMGFIAEDENAWKLARMLIHEGIQVAKAMGLPFDEAAITERVRKTSLDNPQGCASIRADLRDGRKTQVDTRASAIWKIRLRGA